MNNYDKRLIERLRNWEKVYPEDEDKPEGDLYLEAAERIVELLNNQPEHTLEYDQEDDGFITVYPPLDKNKGS